ncbi:hypothetical protein GCM10009639_52230 [Kitasatospora putterlickiae]|uniref:Uncharacterized protein n=1 Tax=Kitasatospora putterlickiae TaxID=221725 RepID=A0ABN1YD84_9ACTN
MSTTARLNTDTGEVLDDTAPEPFADFLVQHMGGRVHDDASRELRELNRAVSEHGKKGTLAVIVTVEAPKGHVEGGPLSIAVATVLKAPKGITPASVYYLDREGNTSRRDPRQDPLFDDPAGHEARVRSAVANALRGRADAVPPDLVDDLVAGLTAAGYRQQQ